MTTKTDSKEQIKKDDKDDPYELLEKADKYLAELDKIRSQLPRFNGASEEQAFFGLSKSIITSRRHVSVLMGSLEGNTSSKAKYYR